MVVAFHAGLPVPGGFVGVDIFFVISGFVITGMLHREWSATGRIRFGRFYLRRFKRLTPALALMVTATMLISALVLSPLGGQQNAAKAGVGATLMVANFVIDSTTGGYFDVPAASNPLLHTWSLSVEEQFYVVFPAILALGWVIGRRGRLLRIAPHSVVVAIGALSFGVVALTALGDSVPGASWLHGFYSPFTRAWEFAAGALLALILREREVLRTRYAASCGAAGAVMLGASMWLITSKVVFPGPWTVLPVAGTLLLLAAGTAPTSPLSRVLATRPFVKVGDWSYSIYLWHWPLIVFAHLLWPGNRLALGAAAIVSVVPALVSYSWVEQPIRRLGGLGPRRLMLLVVLTLTPPLLLSASLWFAADQAFWSSNVREYRASVIPFHAGLRASCDTALAPSARPQGSCVWNPSAAGAPVYLVGDSNADHFSEGLINATSALDRPLLISTANGCPFVDVSFTASNQTQAWNDGCRDYAQQTLKDLTASPAGLVIISNSDVYWRDPLSVVGADRLGSRNDPDQKLEAFRDGLTSTVNALVQSGHQVLLMQTSPKWIGANQWDPNTCTSVEVISGQCRQRMSLEGAEVEQGSTRAIMTAVSEATGAALWDSWDALCTDGWCSTHTEDGVLRYRDANHISVPQSESLTGVLESVLSSASATSP